MRNWFKNVENPWIIHIQPTIFMVLLLSSLCFNIKKKKKKKKIKFCYLYTLITLYILYVTQGNSYSFSVSQTSRNLGHPCCRWPVGCYFCQMYYHQSHYMHRPFTFGIKSWGKLQNSRDCGMKPALQNLHRPAELWLLFLDFRIFWGRSSVKQESWNTPSGIMSTIP